VRAVLHADRSPVIEKFLLRFENAVDDAGETEAPQLELKNFLHLHRL
jgi:hypothetical protein